MDVANSSWIGKKGRAQMKWNTTSYQASSAILSSILVWCTICSPGEIIAFCAVRLGEIHWNNDNAFSEI